MNKFDKIKRKGQVFTPTEVVKYMLNDCSYYGGLYEHTILEPSCGNGAFLKQIVSRLIQIFKYTKGTGHEMLKKWEETIIPQEGDSPEMTLSQDIMKLAPYCYQMGTKETFERIDGYLQQFYKHN